MSQLDLALAADVSARHISFLETGRSLPSREMILRLGVTLDVPMRDQNAMLEAAGLRREFEAPSFDKELSPAIDDALARMMDQHEPYPLVIMNRIYDVLRANQGAQRLLSRFLADPSALDQPPNAFRILFDPRLMRPFVVEWDRVARIMLARLHREVLATRDEALAELANALLDYPNVPSDWRTPDMSVPSEPVMVVTGRRDGLELSWLTTLTVFNAPQNVTMEDLKIESYFPLDEGTKRTVERLLAEDIPDRPQ